MFRIAQKLEIIHREVKGWSKHNFGDFRKEKMELSRALDSLQP